MDQSLERWLPVAGYEGFYEVSSHGRVRSLDREVLGKDGMIRLFRGRVLRPGITPGGYLKVVPSKNGIQVTLAVHSLVLESFIGPKPKGMEACHNDGNRLNNRLSNLRWDTPEANRHDITKHGTRPMGEHHPCATLTAIEVMNIREEFHQHRKRRKNAEIIAERYGISWRTVYDIAMGRRWKHT
jgi:hypothetical protein